MLLNVGPTPEGTLTPEEIERLTSVGKWMDVNSEAIYGTKKSPFAYDFEWGAVSLKPGKLYLHVLKWNAEGIQLHGLTSTIARAYLLADPTRKLTVDQDVEKGTVTIAAGAKAPDANISILVVETEGKVTVDPSATGKYHWDKSHHRKPARPAKPKGKGRRKNS